MARATLWSLLVAAGVSGQAFQVVDLASGRPTNHGGTSLPAGDPDLHLLGWQDDDHGKELWILDGLQADLELLVDLVPGPAASNPDHFALDGGRWFFSAETPDAGRELWSSDGTRPGTGLYADLEPGVGSSRPSDLLFVASRLYFVATTEAAGRELWTVDGGAPVLLDLVPGPGSSNPEHLAAGPNGGVYFAAETANGVEPWFSLGTLASTAPIGTLGSAPDGSEPHAFHAVAPDLVVFVATSPTLGEELVVYEEGTQSFTWYDTPGTGGFSGSPRQLSPLRPGDFLYSATTASNGREPYYWQVGDTPTEIANLGEDNEDSMSESSATLGIGSTGYFAADDGQSGFELWVTDGSSVQQLSDIELGPGSSSPKSFFAHAGLLYFRARSSALGEELWVSDATVAGTRLREDLAPGDASSFARPFAQVSGAPLVETSGPFGQNLYLDGGGSSRLQAVAASKTTSSHPSQLAARGDRVFFAATNEQGEEPWLVELEQTGARRTAFTAESLGDLNPGAGGSLPDQFVPAQLTLFVADRGTLGEQAQLWNGTSVSEIVLRASGSALPESLVEVSSGLLLTSRTTSTLARQVVHVDPFTQVATELTSTGEVLDVSSPTPGRHLFFSSHGTFFAYEDDNGAELWLTDGTPGGTGPIDDFVAGPGDFITSSQLEAGMLNRHNNDTDLLVFAAQTENDGRELFVSDGTVQGTELVADLVPGPDSSSPRRFLVNRDRAIFELRGPGPSEVYVTDGSAANTLQLTDRSTGFQPFFNPLPLAALGDGWIFLDSRLDLGTELWFTDGTPGGTVPLDLWPGVDSSRPQPGVVAQGRYYFFATTPATGMELWSTDGTMAGTRLEADTIAGAVGQARDDLTQPVATPDYLVFSANGADGSGVELWGLPLSFFDDGFESGTVSVWSSSLQ